MVPAAKAVTGDLVIHVHQRVGARHGGELRTRPDRSDRAHVEQATAMVQLLAFITGSFAMSTSVGFPVLFVFHHGLFGVTNTDGSKAQIVIGVLILLIAVLLATDVPAGRFTRRPTTPTTPTKPTKKFPTRAQSLLQGGSPWFSGAMGMSAALPSVDYMALLVLIAASGATPVAQAGALLTFIVVANTLAAIPLGSYLIAPTKTGALLGRFHDWIRARRRRDFAALLAVAGGVMIALGITGL
jgi:Sap, sulfolipid-1-addressing protein